MYTPDAMKLSDKKHIFDFIDAYSFGLVVSPSLNASHLPFILDRSSSSQGRGCSPYFKDPIFMFPLPGIKPLPRFPHGTILPFTAMAT